MINLLVVDDEKEICTFLKEWFEEKDFSVDFAVTGEEALRLIKEKTWHLALIDLKLATSVSGLDVIEAILRKHPKTIICAMTGYVDVSLRFKAEHLGVSEFLEKPDDIEPEKLHEKFMQLLSRKKDDK